MTFFLSFGCWIEPYWCMNFIETVHNIQSNSVHYFLSWTNHSLAPLKIRRYHHFSCPTQQLFYKVEIICFSIILMTNKPFFSRIHISIPSSFFNIYILTPVPDQISVISHSYNFEYNPTPQRAQFFGDACVGPPGGIQPERKRHWRFLSCWLLSIYI